MSVPAGAAVSARPVRTSRWVLSASTAIVLVALVFAIMLPRSATMGADVTALDRLSMFGLGVAVALVVACPAWPRMRADARAVWTRGFIGGYREVPWSLVHGVEFPPTARWARLVLADDEAISVYAVQRADGAASVEVMNRLRALHREAWGEKDVPD